MQRSRIAILATFASLALASCGGDSKSDTEDARKDAGKTYCEKLQKEGALLEPMSQCLKEYDDATKEPQ